MQSSDKLEYIKVGGLQEDASIFWERINSGFFDITIDQTQIKMLRNFYKLNPMQGYKLQKYADRKSQEKQINSMAANNVLQEENYLSSEHEKDDDSIRNIIEENDEIYEEINYMDTYEEMKDDPERKAFL